MAGGGGGGPPRVLVLGATGGCGGPAVGRLLERGAAVTAVVRSAGRLPPAVRGHPRLRVVEAPGGHLGLDLREHLAGVQAVVSSLGHKLTPRGIWGPPWRLCRDTVRQVAAACRDLEAPGAPVRLIVVSTEGVSRPDGADPPRGFGERLLLGALSLLLPPVADNEATLAVLAQEVAGDLNPFVEFCAVRPSDMDDGERSEYALHETLQHGAFAGAGASSRANVGHCLAELAVDDALWARWRGRWPHLLNAPPPPASSPP